MTEILFILTAIYVAYVVYKVTNDTKVETQVSEPSSSETILTPSGSVSAVETTVIPAAKSTVTAAAAKPAPVVKEKAEAKVKAPVVSSNDLRHPETGETAKVSNNYRGLKRWIKEALVTEGLLEKIYPNNELTDENNAKIKHALETLKTMSKYHA